MDESKRAAGIAGQDEGRPLQDLLPVHCYGCGVLNPQGLQIKSRWIGDECVCRWSPQPHHIGHPGFVYGGTIASVIDCHGIWTAMSHLCRLQGHRLSDGPPPFAFVTGRLTVNYRQPATIAEPLELRARVVESGERKLLVACRVLQGTVECAAAEIIAVRVKAPASAGAGTPEVADDTP